MNLKEMLKFVISVCMASFLIIGCSSKRTVIDKKVSKDGWGNELPFSVGKDADGNPVMKSNKRSSFEKKILGIGGGKDFKHSSYKVGSYRRKSWKGNTLYKLKKYQGKTRANIYNQQPWYVRKQVRLGRKVNPSSKKAFAWNPFKTKTVTSGTMPSYQVNSDASVDRQRRIYPRPDITNWKGQEDLTVKDTNGMLGR